MGQTKLPFPLKCCNPSCKQEAPVHQYFCSDSCSAEVKRLNVFREPINRNPLLSSEVLLFRRKCMIAASIAAGFAIAFTALA